MFFQKNKNTIAFSIQILIYSILFLVFYKKYFYSFGPDFVGYYAIAKNYANGNFNAAINTWWSPLYSWLLAILIKIYDAPLVINKVLQFIVGWYGLVICKQFIYSILKEKLSYYIELLGIGFIPFFVIWSLKTDTPDLLVAVLLLHFIKLVFELIAFWSIKKSIFAGIIGGLSFLAKSFNFYFLLAFSFICLVYFLWCNKNKKEVIKNYLTIALPFVIIVFLWAFALFLKTNKWMLTSRAELSICNITLEKKQSSTLESYDCSGLGLDSSSVYSNWEQPYLYPSNSFVQQSQLYSMISKISNNFFIFSKKYLSIYILIFLFLGVVSTFSTFKKYLFLGLSYFLIYCFGHFLFHLEPRFFLMPFLLLMIFVAVTLIQFFKNKKLEKYNWVISIILIILFSKTPLLQLINEPENELPKQMKRFSMSNNNIGIQKNIAAEKGLFEEALYFCFYTNNKCVGSLNVNLNTEDANKQLQSNNVDFILVKNNNQYELIPHINNKSIQIR